jgi:hypothetical protein
MAHNRDSRRGQDRGFIGVSGSLCVGTPNALSIGMLRNVIAHQWYRIDKSDGKLLAVNSMAVYRAASGSFITPQEIIQIGRFSTPFAMYSRGDQLTEQEREIR